MIEHQGTPFIIFGLPRSRTAWLSAYLSYGGYTCGHDQARYVRGLDDIKSWLAQDFTGTAETGAAPWWRLITKWRPDIRILIVRRDPAEVVESLLNLNMHGFCTFDAERVCELTRRQNAKLDQLEARLPQALTVRYHDLNSAATCARIFRHCLGYEFDEKWWNALKDKNVQISMPAMMRYVGANAVQITRAAALAKQKSLALMSRQHKGTVSDDITIQEEPFDTFLRDGEHLFAQHALTVNEHPQSFRDKNLPFLRQIEAAGNLQVLTARSNGKMFGYLLTVIGPSLESTNGVAGFNTAVYASPEFPGLGMKLHRAAAQHAAARGASEMQLRAGVRGEGPNLGAIYKRMGAVEDGQLYRLSLGG